MRLRRSQYAHLVPLPDGRDVCLQAATGTATVLSDALLAVARYFDSPRESEQAIADLKPRLDAEADAVDGEIRRLLKRGILTELSPDEELAAFSRRLAPVSGHDPLERLRSHRREHARIPLSYPMGSPQANAGEAAAGRPTYHVILMGDCDVHEEAAFIRAEGRRRGIDLDVTATFPDDIRLLTERPHDAVILGALRGRDAMVNGRLPHRDGDSADSLIDEGREMLARVRAVTSSPIVMNNLPIPTMQPLGIAGRGLANHRNTFRRVNLGLDRIADEFPDVYVADVDAALAAAGKQALLDDSFKPFSHLASLGWVVAGWPDAEQAASLGAIPDIASLAARVGDDPYAFEACIASEHVDKLIAILGIDRRKAVIVDLDGTLWPGVLAETGRPFLWHPDVRQVHLLYIGIHEALKSLARRGILLACVSKNDEATVRELWRYEDHEPRELLLTLDEFASVRINWNDKVDNIRAVADEMNLAYDQLVFVDDSPFERERVRRALPDVLVLGEDLFELRPWLLSDPRLQPLTITAESATRTQLVKAQAQRERLRSSFDDEAAFRESLELVCQVERLKPGDDVRRLKELFERTTQFNTTGRKFTIGELQQLAESPSGHVFSLRVVDRFGDHGLVGGCVAVERDVIALAVSCRVLGIGVEHRFMSEVLAELALHYETVTASIVTTSRNVPVRNIYKDHGFVPVDGASTWRLDVRRRTAVS